MSDFDPKETPVMMPTALLTPIAIPAFQCVTAAGDTLDELYSALIAHGSCLTTLDLFDVPFDTLVGVVKTPLPIPRSALKAYDCRNARLALKALEQGDLRHQIATAKQRYGAARLGVVLGTSTSGIYDTEQAYAHMQTHQAMPDNFDFLHTHTAQATAEFLSKELDLQGPCYAISTACSSSAKALAAAQRLIMADVCDAVLVAGVDSLCRLTLRGFNSLQLISPDNCRPMDVNRNGINIGEGAALLLLERSHADNAHCPRLLAVGESSDAYHMSAPHPEGAGALAAMALALKLGGREAQQLDHINLHATASTLNDLSEAKAISRFFINPPPCSGVKGLIGHTLGAAGAVEVVICLLAMQRNFLPGTFGLQQQDPLCAIPMLTQPRLAQSVKLVLSNAFGFGGNNASVLLEAPE